MLKFLAGLISIAFVAIFVFYLFNQPRTETRRFLSFTIVPNESFKSVSMRLDAEGLIRSEPFFYYLGRISGKSGHLKAGEYELNTQMSAWEILKVVTGSHVKLYRITIKEGDNMFQIARSLNQAGLVDEIQFLEMCWDRTFLAELQIPSFTVEGYLFPETYYIPRGSSARAIIRMFVDMFWSRIPNDFIQRAKKGPYSLHQLVIMASMIEKETGLAGEMSTISSVFHNRLEKRMKLQSDPTAVYDLQPYGGRVTRQHLFRKTPFNTYIVPSLPLTPISNPGILSLQAALHPENTEYLYFVSRRDGSHYFSKNYDEHRQAIQKFLQ